MHTLNLPKYILNICLISVHFYMIPFILIWLRKGNAKYVLKATGVEIQPCNFKALLPCLMHIYSPQVRSLNNRNSVSKKFCVPLTILKQSYIRHIHINIYVHSWQIKYSLKYDWNTFVDSTSNCHNGITKKLNECYPDDEIYESMCYL